MSKYYDAIKVVLCGESGVGKQEFMRCILLIGFPNINIGKMNSINTPFQKTIYYKKYKKYYVLAHGIHQEKKSIMLSHQYIIVVQECAYYCTI